MSRKIEFFINNRLFKTCPYDKWDKTEKEVISLIKKKGYHSVYSDDLHKLVHYEAKVFVNPQTYKCIVYTYRIDSGYKDGKGNKIYDDDTVITPYGFNSQVYHHWNGDLLINVKPTPYYVRKDNENSWGWHDKDVENFKDYEKIKDWMGLPKEKWNKPDKITINEL